MSALANAIDIRRIQLAALAMTGFFAAVAGVLTATRLASGSSNSGTLFELEVITAVVLGGTSLMGGRGSILGSVVGALTLGVISNGLVLLRVDVDFRDAADRAWFAYSLDGAAWTPIGDDLAMEYSLDHFTGYRFAIFCYATARTGGHVDVDWFRVGDEIGGTTP